MKKSLPILILLAACQPAAEVQEPQSGGAPPAAQRIDIPAEAKPLFSMNDYGYLRLGMLQSEAEEILGGAGEELSSSQIGSIHTAMYRWRIGSAAAVTATFQNEKLVAKAQSGLR